jgi:predicted SAM-dependent methyltransferase
MNYLFKIAQAFFINIDRLCGTQFKPFAGNLYRYGIRCISPFRRRLDPLVIRLAYSLGFNRSKKIKLHLGCGHKHFDGYINMDLWLNEAVDVVGDITKLPWPDDTANVLESYHVIEHLPHPKVPLILKEWFRVLERGGRMVLECPHFDETVKEYLIGNESRLENIFGHQRFPGDAHMFGYTPQRLIRLLEQAGFKNFNQTPPQSSQALEEPSFRIECCK